MQIKEIDMTSGKDLYADVRGAFIRNHDTFTGWCKRNGFNVSNTRQALLGSWSGEKGKKVKQEVIDASGLLGSQKETNNE